MRFDVVIRLIAPIGCARRTDRPTVRGDRVAIEEISSSRRFATPWRYLRSVDLVKIVALAPEYDQVPDLYAAYNRAGPPVPAGLPRCPVGARGQGHARSA
jgi:hypothetical protein